MNVFAQVCVHVSSVLSRNNQISRYFANMTTTKMICIDMRSDTVTKPTPEMRAAMMNAEVGDDVYSEDPTVNKLQQKMAAILGKESALFFPSGTMANLTAMMVHASRRGDEVIIGDRSHIGMWEQGGVAQLGGIFPRQVRNLDDGTLDLEELKSKIFNGGRDGHLGHTKLVCVENTQNYAGGRPLSLDYMTSLHNLTSPRGIKIHVDGARIFNAAAGLKVSAADLVKHADSVSVCLSKGVGAPVGSILSGSKDFIDQAHRVRKSLGGGMRQVGILAAAGIVALDTIVPKLEIDHQNAKLFAKLLQETPLPGIAIDPVHTNMMLMRFKGAKIGPEELIHRLENPTDPQTGVIIKTGMVNESLIRFVIHHQITEQDIRLAAARIKELLEN